MYGDRTPDEYSFPDGKVKEVSVTKEFFEILLGYPYGVWASAQKAKECLVEC